MQDHILEIKKLIPASICEKIVSYYDYGFEDAAVTSDKPGGAIVKNLRNCQIKNILDSYSFGEKIMLNYIKDKLFTALNSYTKKFNEFYFEELSQLDILKYESNSYDAGYKYHVDMGPKSTPRHVSISLCLNNDFEGGEFKFKLSNGEFQYPQNVGDCIMFPSNFMFPHQVNRVTKGTRYALIGWAV